jgi:hypothetical protein
MATRAVSSTSVQTHDPSSGAWRAHGADAADIGRNRVGLWRNADFSRPADHRDVPDRLPWGQMPDIKSAAAFSLTFSAGGRVKAIKTTALMTIEEGVEAKQKAAALADHLIVKLQAAAAKGLQIMGHLRIFPKSHAKRKSTSVQHVT